MIVIPVEKQQKIKKKKAHHWELKSTNSGENWPAGSWGEGSSTTCFSCWNGVPHESYGKRRMASSIWSEGQKKKKSLLVRTTFANIRGNGGEDFIHHRDSQTPDVGFDVVAFLVRLRVDSLRLLDTRTGDVNVTLLS